MVPPHVDAQRHANISASTPSTVAAGPLSPVNKHILLFVQIDHYVREEERHGHASNYANHESDQLHVISKIARTCRSEESIDRRSH